MNGLDDVFENIQRNGIKNAPEDAVKIDGILYCPECNTPIQCRQFLLGRNYLMPVLCKCGEERLKAKESERREQERLEQVMRMRNTLLCNPVYFTMTFENSDTERVYARNYVSGFKKYKAENTGLLLWGNLGTGKTFDAACIANALIDKGYTAYMATVNQMVQYAGDYDTKVDYMKRIKNYDLLIIDDFGADRGTDFTCEQVYNIINTRICSRKPMVITTNLSPSEMAECTDLKLARSYQRILEICHPVCYDGKNRRLSSGRVRYKELESELKI